MKILIDNGHGIQTKGKRSPDGQLLEYAYTRELARQIVAALKARGYDSELLVPKDDDIPLSKRTPPSKQIKNHVIKYMRNPDSLFRNTMVA